MSHYPSDCQTDAERERYDAETSEIQYKFENQQIMSNMTPQEKSKILTKAIAKAKSNGFILLDEKHCINIGKDVFGDVVAMVGYESVIFDPNFAKAFFGEVEMCGENESGEIPHSLEECRCEYRDLRPAWEHYLQQMVLEEDPILYLSKFID